MLFIQRNPAQAPELFQEPSFRHRIRELSEAAAKGEQVRGDIYSLIELVRTRVHKEVQTQFESKCAYCEMGIHSTDAQIDWFRPPFGAERQDGRIDQHHYIWLIGEWENLYLCCKECSNLKRNVFPASSSTKYGMSINQLRRQHEGKLIDPCWDHPEQYFEITSSGTLQHRRTRGQLTIELLALNRDYLCDLRINALQRFFDVWNDQIERAGQVATQHFRDLYDVLGQQAPFVGTIYLFLWQVSTASTRRTLRLMIDTGPTDNSIRYLLRVLGPLSISMAVPRTDQVIRPSARSEGWELAFRPVSSVLIENFKGISHLEIQVPRFSDQSLAIVGENATGKTSVLQAIALGLAGPREANRLVPDARNILAEGAQEGRIVIHFHEAREVNELYFTRTSARFQGAAPRSVKVFGYGPYRLLAKRELGVRKRGERVRLSSLFDDAAKLNGYHGWLNILNDQQRRDLAEVLQLLLVSRETRVSVDVNNLRIRTNGKEHPIDSLSSGMQSVVSMCTDIMEALYAAGDSVLKDGHIILVDELDAHLHPAWRLGILPRLQRAFPKAQIMFSTHDALTLRGMKSGQIHVLARDDEGTVRDALSSYSDAQSIDQVLTSPLFGLFSTHTREWERQYSEYIDLLLKKDLETLSDAENSQLDWLMDELNTLRILGDTPRERLMYSVIDRFLAQKPRNKIEWDESVVDDLAAMIQAGLEAPGQEGPQ